MNQREYYLQTKIDRLTYKLSQKQTTSFIMGIVCGVVLVGVIGLFGG